MTEIQKGQAYVAKRVYSGKASDGNPYTIIVVQSPGKKQPKIAISVINLPCRISSSGVFKITGIKSVMHRNWRDSNGRWHPGSVTVRAWVKPLVQLAPEELEELNYKETAPEFPSLEDLFS